MGWTQDILARENQTHQDSAAHLDFPIIADKTRAIVHALGMLDPEEVTAEGIALPARALVILQGATIKLSLVYPASTGRDFDEVFRVLVSLQMTAGQGLATPVNWKYGERVVVTPKLSSDMAKKKFTNFQVENLPSEKTYLRSVDCPPEGRLINYLIRELINLPAVCGLPS